MVHINLENSPHRANTSSADVLVSVDSGAIIVEGTTRVTATFGAMNDEVTCGHGVRTILQNIPFVNGQFLQNSGRNFEYLQVSVKVSLSPLFWNQLTFIEAVVAVAPYWKLSTGLSAAV